MENPENVIFQSVCKSVLEDEENSVCEASENSVSKNEENSENSVTENQDNSVSEHSENSISNFTCPACLKEFNFERIPEELECGHTFCIDCIVALKVSEGHCGECSNAISFPEIKTNHNILRLMIVECSEKFFKIVENVEKEFSEKSSLFREREEKLTSIRKHMKTIQRYLDNPETIDRFALPYILGCIDEVKKDVKFIPNIFVEPNNDPKAFLFKIYEEIISGGTLQTVHQRVTKNFDTEFVFGKITTLYDNILYFHCLQQEKPKNCDKFIRFDDLKKAVKKCIFRLFLEVDCDVKLRRIISIKPIISLITSQFIHLCTGEKGPSYIGKDFQLCNQYVKSLKNCTINMRENNMTDYLFEENYLEYPVSRDGSKCAVYGNDDGNGSFSLSKSSYGYNNTLIGEIESPADVFGIFKDLCTILNCGISLQVKI